MNYLDISPDSTLGTIFYVTGACLLPVVGTFIWGLPGFLWTAAISVSLLVAATLVIAAAGIASSICRRLLQAKGQDVPSYREFPGFFLPFGVTRVLSYPAEYLAVVNAVNGHKPSARILLRATARMQLTAHGLASEGFLRAAYRSDKLKEALDEAVILLGENSPDSVVQFAQHPSGILRGFELMRTGIAYEYAEMLP